MVTGSNKIVPLLIRLKKDKKIGMNMSSNNSAVVSCIDRNLKRVIKDIEGGAFETFTIKPDFV